jgi:predicted nucleic acid-binding Zn ribbon protein
MSKKKTKTREDKIVKKHDFSHLTKTKTAAKVVEAEIVTNDDTKSPLDKEIKKDTRATLIIIGVFVLAIVALWLLVGRNGEIFRLYDKIRLF